MVEKLADDLRTSAGMLVKRGLDEMVRQEEALVARGPGEDGRMWLKKLAELEAQKERLLDLYLENKLDMDRYEKRLAQIEQARRGVEDDLARIESRTAYIDRLEHNRDAVLNYYSQIVFECLDALEPNERNRVYKMLNLTVRAHENGSFELTRALGADPCRDNEPLPRWSSASTTDAFRFRTVLTGDGGEEVELARVERR